MGALEGAKKKLKKKKDWAPPEDQFGLNAKLADVGKLEDLLKKEDPSNPSAFKENLEAQKGLIDSMLAKPDNDEPLKAMLEDQRNRVVGKLIIRGQQKARAIQQVVATAGITKTASKNDWNHQGQSKGRKTTHKQRSGRPPRKVDKLKDLVADEVKLAQDKNAPKPKIIKNLQDQMPILDDLLTDPGLDDDTRDMLEKQRDHVRKRLNDPFGTMKTHDDVIAQGEQQKRAPRLTGVMKALRKEEDKAAKEPDPEEGEVDADGNIREDTELKERARKLDELKDAVADEVDMAIKTKQGDPPPKPKVIRNLQHQKGLLEDLLGPWHGPKLDADTGKMLQAQLEHVNKRLQPKPKKKDDDPTEYEDDFEPYEEVFADKDDFVPAHGSGPRVPMTRKEAKELQAKAQENPRVKDLMGALDDEADKVEDEKYNYDEDRKRNQTTSWKTGCTNWTSCRTSSHLAADRQKRGAAWHAPLRLLH